jgi:hypothetical protein
LKLVDTKPHGFGAGPGLQKGKNNLVGEIIINKKVAVPYI